MPQVPELSRFQFESIYNFLSLAIAAMLFTAIYLLASQRRVLPAYRNALVISAMVCGIAAYHYFRIFDSFKAAYVTDAVGGDGIFSLAEGVAFNEGYRYVDWLLTVPLLLMETIAVLALAKAERSRLLARLIPASAAMIILGYPGEIAMTNGPRAFWGALSTIPFLYILYILFVELTKSLDRQPPEVAATVKRLRLLLFATWGVYPIAYLFPMVGFDGADAFVLRQVGYTVADVLAKALYGLVIYKIARMKSFADDPVFESEEMGGHVSTTREEASATT